MGQYKDHKGLDELQRALAGKTVSRRRFMEGAMAKGLTASAATCRS